MGNTNAGIFNVKLNKIRLHIVSKFNFTLFCKFYGIVQQIAKYLFYPVSVGF